jgi:hypothetical protein
MLNGLYLIRPLILLKSTTNPCKSWKNVFIIVHKGYQKKRNSELVLKRCLTPVLNAGKKIFHKKADF